MPDFVNDDAYANYKKLALESNQHLTPADNYNNLLKRVVNLEQLVLESKRHIERLSTRLTSTGTEKIGQ